MFGFTGVNLADTHGRAFFRIINPGSLDSMLLAEGTLKPAYTKVIDTSCIIDGRIESLLETGFIEGQILVPQFILQELQLVADAANDQKRVRGRRGLDILNRLREDYPDQISIHSIDYEIVDCVSANKKLTMDRFNSVRINSKINRNSTFDIFPD